MLGLLVWKARLTQRRASVCFFIPRDRVVCAVTWLTAAAATRGRICRPVAGMGNRRRLVESIITPSKEIAPQFTRWSVAKTDGTVFSGILLEQTPEGDLVFADSNGHGRWS